MENFVLIAILGILSLYFFSSANVYKSLYRKIKEEKELLEEEKKKAEELLKRYEDQMSVSSNALGLKQDALKIARTDLQKIHVENMELKSKIAVLEKRNDELYAQVNAII